MLKKVKGQASIEYFVLLIVITSLTLLSLSTFFPRVLAAGEEFFAEAVRRIIP